MKPLRATIAGSLGMIAVLAVGLMGLREAMEVWASLMFGLTLLILLGSTLHAFLQPASQRAGYLGFALFGWLYLALNFGPWATLDPPPLPSAWIADVLFTRLHPSHDPVDSALDAYFSSEAIKQRAALKARIDRSGTGLVYHPNPTTRLLKPGSKLLVGDGSHFRQTAHALGALLFGAIGSLWALWIESRNPEPAG